MSSLVKFVSSSWLKGITWYIAWWRFLTSGKHGSFERWRFSDKGGSHSYTVYINLHNYTKERLEEQIIWEVYIEKGICGYC